MFLPRSFPIGRGVPGCLGGLLGLVAFVSGAGCAPVPSPISTGSDGGALPPLDGEISSEGGPGAASDAGSCGPGEVATYHPTYPPASVLYGACTMGQVQGLYDACFGSNKSTDRCSDFRASNAACSACIITPESAPAYGPLIEHSGFVSTNVAGCIEVDVADGWASDAGAAELTCAHAVQALEGCELAACEANCEVYDSTSLAAFTSCAQSADQGGCGTFASAAACLDPASDAALPIPAACLEADFATFYAMVVPIFCVAPPPYDAGVGPSLDAGSGPTFDAGGEAPDTGPPAYDAGASASDGGAASD